MVSGYFAFVVCVINLNHHFAYRKRKQNDTILMGLNINFNSKHHTISITQNTTPILR
jgi:hypothetical protein